MYLYKYKDNRRHSFSADIEEQIFEVEKETPKSYYIKRVADFGNDRLVPLFNEKRWVRKNAIRKFAFETKEEAMRNYRYKKRAQVRIIENKLYEAKIRHKKAQERDPSYNPNERDWYRGEELFELKKSKYNRYASKYPLYPQLKNKGFFLTEEDFDLDVEL